MNIKSRINKNSLPFLILLLFHLILLFLLVKKKNQRFTWILLLTNIGFAYLFEFVVLNLFKAYTYKPRILKKQSFDNILGAILSQALFVPITSTFLTIFQKNTSWKLAASFIYFCIEMLFISLQVYKTHWWKPLYTLVLINVYFYISDWFYKLLQQRKPVALKMAHYFSIEVIGVTFMYVTAIRRRIRFGLGRYHSWQEHFMIAPLYSLIMSVIALFLSAKKGYGIWLLHIIIGSAIDLSLVSMKILKIRSKQWIETVLFHFFMFLISRYLYQLIYKEV